VFGVKLELSEALLRDGDLSGALALLEDCRRLVEENDGSPQARVVAWRSLGIANMRMAERQNCVANHNPESCILPISEAAIHRDRSGGEAAVSCFAHALEIDPMI
jgi:hypothetical protein